MKHWRIHVVSWGTLWAYGTEEEAEQWRAHKANWEQSIARKYELTRNEINERNGSGGQWTILSDLLSDDRVSVTRP